MVKQIDSKEFNEVIKEGKVVVDLSEKGQTEFAVRYCTKICGV